MRVERDRPMLRMAAFAALALYGALRWATLTPEQAKQFSDGEWYVNVHTQSHPAGEIRGQVVPPKS